MLNAGSVEGIVTDETGKPVPGITLALLAPSLRSPATRTAQTDALGRYRFDGVPPVVRILTSFAPEQAAIAGKSYQPTEIERVELSAGATRQLNLQVTSTPVYRIRGHVTNKPDTEPSFAAVKLCEGDDKNTLALRVPVASDGTFEAPGFVPGNYCVHLEVGADSTQNSYAVVANVRDRDTDQVELKAWAPFVP
jgi:hypothetical protein